MKKNQNNINITDNIYYICRTILIIGLPLTTISALLLGLPHSSATTSGTDNFTVNISTACTISSTVNSEHFINANIGTYNPGVGKTTITTLCNDGNGYSIYANGYSNNEEGNNKLINSAYPQYSISTGLATSGLTSAWAMKLNNIENDPSPTPPSIASNYNDTYGLVPNTWTKVAYRQSGTTDMSQGSSFTTTYSVYASSSQYNGTYNGQVKYVLLHPYKNDSTITTVPTFEESFALGGKEKVIVNGIGYYKMQDMSSLICGRVSNTEETPTIQLVDIRDNKLYWVAKLADNNCWMTQNLDLDLSSSVALTSETSDIDPDTYNTGIYTETTGYSKDETTGVVSWLPSTIANSIQQADTKVISWSSDTAATVPGWTNNNNNPYSADAGDRYLYTDETGNETIFTSFNNCSIDTDNAKDCQHSHIGNYYNWSAAVASNNTSATANYAAYNNSICPKNWDLPANGKYGTMLSAQGITDSNYIPEDFLKIRISPLYFVQSGCISSSTLSGISNTGHYWSNLVRNNNSAFFLNFNSSNLNPTNGGSYDRGYGRSIRCVINAT